MLHESVSGGKGLQSGQDAGSIDDFRAADIQYA